MAISQGRISIHVTSSPPGAIRFGLRDGFLGFHHTCERHDALEILCRDMLGDYLALEKEAIRLLVEAQGYYDIDPDAEYPAIAGHMAMCEEVANAW